jgi:hypothetical protein
MLFDTDRIRANQRMVLAFARQQRPADPAEDFFAALAMLQHGQSSAGDAAAPSRLVFELDDPRAKILLKALRGAEELGGRDSIRAIAPADRAGVSAGVTAGAALLARLRPDIGEAFELLTSTVVACSVANLASGSHEPSIGTFWIAPTPYWTTADYAMALAHETVHQLLFIEDMVHRLFACDRGELSRADALVYSPLRAQSRPYCVAFHAACVAATLADLAQHAGLGRHDPIVCGRLSRTLAELHRKRHYLTPYGQSLLDGVIARAGPRVPSPAREPA